MRGGAPEILIESHQISPFDQLLCTLPSIGCDRSIEYLALASSLALAITSFSRRSMVETQLALGRLFFHWLCEAQANVTSRVTPSVSLLHVCPVLYTSSLLLQAPCVRFATTTALSSVPPPPSRRPSTTTLHKGNRTKVADEPRTDPRHARLRHYHRRLRDRAFERSHTSRPAARFGGWW